MRPVATGDKAQQCPNCVMNLTLRSSHTASCTECILVSDDLQYFYYQVNLANMLKPNYIGCQSPPSITLKETVNSTYTGGENHPKVHALFEPMRCLFGLSAPSIEGPISKSYALQVINNMVRPMPRSIEVFQRVYSISRDAIAAFEEAHSGLSVRKLRYAIAIWRDYHVWFGCGRDEGLRTKIGEGEFSGLSIKTAMKILSLRLSMRVAIYYVRLTTINAFEEFTDMEYNGPWTRLGKAYCSTQEPPGGRDYAQLFLLAATTTGAFKSLDVGEDSIHLEDTMLMLKEALRHEPSNIDVKLRLEQVDRALEKQHRRRRSRAIRDDLQMYYESKGY